MLAMAMDTAMDTDMVMDMAMDTDMEQIMVMDMVISLENIAMVLTIFVQN